MVDRPVSFVLHDSVASSDPEEGFTLWAYVWFHISWLDRQLSQHLRPLLFVSKMIEDLLLLNLPVLEEHVKCRLTKRNDVFKNIPEDTLREWSRGQRASVGPSSIVLKQLDEFGEI